MVHLPYTLFSFEVPLMRMKYIWVIYNFWKRKYISVSFKYMSSICQIYGRYILANIYIYIIYVKYILNIQLLEKIYFIHFDIYLTYEFFHVGLYCRLLLHTEKKDLIESIKYLFTTMKKSIWIQWNVALNCNEKILSISNNMKIYLKNIFNETVYLIQINM